MSMLKDPSSAVGKYIEQVQAQLTSGHAKEHAYRPALERLIASFDDILAVNDPKRSAHGNPDFVFLKESNQDVIRGYAEAKDIDIDLDKVETSEQLRRYHGYSNLFLTNYLDFRFFKNGEKYQEISLGKLNSGKLVLESKRFKALEDELKAFLEQPPENIRSGKRLAEIMGGKARRIRDNVNLYLTHKDNEKNAELEKMFKMMRELLVHDLTPEKFADMYAQTLVYGLFVARYHDKSPDTFTRTEARDLVPPSNPFLREFFDHIVGPRFDKRLGHIIDELCEAFAVSDVEKLVHKHLRLFAIEGDRDPVIHFYEDFLQEYDPDERKKMGAYYTPLPVVQFIVRSADQILKSEFGLEGLADTSKTEIRVKRDGKQKRVPVHKVQVLDPAVGTATFLNETIKYIHAGMKGQRGRWSAYAQADLLTRLYGFELMMAPYTIAHLKLGMTLQETGIDDWNQRLGVYLTNTLEEGLPKERSLFSYGLAEVVSEESQRAAVIKNEKPIMVIMGNPPYSINSSNLSDSQRKLIDKYKYVDGKKIKERGAIRFEMNLNDDYVKFIAFAENLIEKNETGILAFINNNNYIDAPTFRGMRNHLLKQFDKIFIINLHGSAKKKEVAEDGTPDENIFGIEQGVCINIFVKFSKSKKPAEIKTIDVLGSKSAKFKFLNENELAKVKWTNLKPATPNYDFVPRDYVKMAKYEKGVQISELFNLYSSGIISANDKVNFSMTPASTEKIIKDFQEESLPFVREKYALKKDTKSWDLARAVEDVKSPKKRVGANRVIEVNYRPFDTRYTYYTGKPMGIMNSPRYPVIEHFLNNENIGLSVCRQFKTGEKFTHVLIHDHPIESGYISNRTSETGYMFPLYIYNGDGTRSANFKPEHLNSFSSALTKKPTPEQVLDYIYAVLYSPRYRDRYSEFLKTDFPRIPAPQDDELFKKLAQYGERLRKLHLASSATKPATTFPIAGSNDVEEIKYEDESIWINKDQYFGGVPRKIWDFQIGGYQPAQKWLKDRKGGNLSNDELVHYQRILTVLMETNRVMQEIDQVIKL